jgi:hypothetical protein
LIRTDGAPIEDRSAPTFHAVETSGALWTLSKTNDAGIGKLGLALIAEVVPTFAPAVRDSYIVSPPDYPYGVSVGCPALAVADDFDVVIGFVAASQLHYLSIYFTGRRWYDPAGVLRPTQLAIAGQPPYYGPPPAGYVRRMDYCDAASTPDHSTLYFALQYTSGVDIRARIFRSHVADRLMEELEELSMVLACLILLAQLGAPTTIAAIETEPTHHPTLGDGATTSLPVEVIPDGPIVAPAWIRESGSPSGALLD